MDKNFVRAARRDPREKITPTLAIATRTGVERAPPPSLGDPGDSDVSL
jgi:hypothetical protein